MNGRIQTKNACLPLKKYQDRTGHSECLKLKCTAPSPAGCKFITWMHNQNIVPRISPHLQHELKMHSSPNKGLRWRSCFNKNTCKHSSGWRRWNHYIKPRKKVSRLLITAATQQYIFSQRSRTPKDGQHNHWRKLTKNQWCKVTNKTEPWDCSHLGKENRQHNQCASGYIQCEIFFFSHTEWNFVGEDTGMGICLIHGQVMHIHYSSDSSATWEVSCRDQLRKTHHIKIRIVACACADCIYIYIYLFLFVETLVSPH